MADQNTGATVKFDLELEDTQDRKKVPDMNPKTP
jgi:hypothetical protein